MEKTNVSWTAYYVYYEPPCEPRETIGYFQIEEDAILAKSAFIEKQKLSEEGLCCSNSKYVLIEVITIN